MKTTGILFGAALVLAAQWGGGVQAQTAGADAAPAVHDGQRDFDGLVGSWNIHLKKLMRPLSGSNAWIEFDGTVVCRPIWDGNGEVEEFKVDSPEHNIHIHGVAIRLYDPKTHEWRIYWANEKNGVMDPAPQVGHFTDGHGEFYSDDTLDGRPIIIRFAWTKVGTERPHFEQAFSADGGKTWEVNWVTDQTRMP